MIQHHLKFAKATGAGNDFILIDNRSLAFDSDRSLLARTLCSRHFGIGADGLILLEPSTRADFLMRYYNADGSFGGMCGNGGRCAARFAFHLGIAGTAMTMEALDFLYSAEILHETVRLRMKDPSRVMLDKGIVVLNQPHSVCFMDTGAPHVVVFSDALDSLDVEHLGKEIRYHHVFAPEGTNVNFVHATGASSTISIRTYERGVEAETLACGTGAVASAVVAHLSRKVTPPVTVRVRSGEDLIVDFHHSGEDITSVSLEGSASIIFRGNVLYESDGVISRIVDPSSLPVI
ncbi:MAG: diaminopimelate epimerase [Ignavibacteria bacterium]|nr:diaminopimelate epimerase [Ignavibacteria bacterium]